MKFKPRKSMTSRYSVSPVNTKYYGSIDPALYSSGSTDSTTEPGIVYLPYVFTYTQPIMEW